MSLIDDARAARAAGMTYGQYIATRTTRQKERRTKPPKKPCLACGKPLPKNKSKYCCPECEHMYRKMAANMGQEPE